MLVSDPTRADTVLFDLVKSLSAISHVSDVREHTAAISEAILRKKEEADERNAAHLAAADGNTGPVATSSASVAESPYQVH